MNGFILFNPQRRCYSQGNCPHGQFCYYYRCCQRNSQRPCSHHAHCPNGWYCDYRARVCKVGERRCSHSYHCSRYQVCVNGKCQKRECYYHNQCKQGHYCASGICKPKPGYCTSQSSCTASQCCAKYYPQQVGGQCKDRKKPGAWCPVKVLYICEGILHYFVCVLFVWLTWSIYRELLYFNHKPKQVFVGHIS